MKKSVILAALGMVAAVANSYGQGHIQFNTYTANSSSQITAQYGNGASSGQLVPNTFTEVLLYSVAPISEAASSIGSAGNPLTGGWSVASTGTIGNTLVPGTAFGPNFDFAGYAGGVVYFEIAAFSGSSYANSLGIGSYAGHTASFSESMATGSTPVWIADGNPANGGSGFLAPSFSVFTSVPEPATLALAGLGGLASLVALRRKQA